MEWYCFSPKWYGYEDLGCYDSIVAEEVQNFVMKIFMEATGNSSNQTLKLVGLLVVVGCVERRIL
jgi:tartrate dehydratase beta subunit/fumarate hydratase class I family protein